MENNDKKISIILFIITIINIIVLLYGFILGEMSPSVPSSFSPIIIKDHYALSNPNNEIIISEVNINKLFVLITQIVILIILKTKKINFKRKFVAIILAFVFTFFIPVKLISPSPSISQQLNKNYHSDTYIYRHENLYGINLY